MAVFLRAAAAAAVLGGLAWAVKAAAILATGDQPPLLFEVAPLLFATACVGLRVLLGRRPGITARIGGWLAGVAVVVGAADLVTGPAATSESDFSPLTFLTFVCVLVALVLLGLPILRRRLLPGATSRLPLLLGLATFPLVAVGGVLETFDERLLEVPLLVVAVVWMWLGTGLWRAEPAS